MSTFSLKNAPAGTQSWFITIYPISGFPLLPKTTLPVNASAQIDVASAVYPRILVIAYSSAAGAPEAYLDGREVQRQSIDSSSSYVFDWAAEKFS